ELHIFQFPRRSILQLLLQDIATCPCQTLSLLHLSQSPSTMLCACQSILFVSNDSSASPWRSMVCVFVCELQRLQNNGTSFHKYQILSEFQIAQLQDLRYLLSHSTLHYTSVYL